MISSVVMASGNVNTDWSGPESSPSEQNHVLDGEHHEYSALNLSIDSGISSAEFSQLHSDAESRFQWNLWSLWELFYIYLIETFSLHSALDFRQGGRYLYDHLDMNGFSEEELLNVTFEACDAAGRGRLSSLLKLTG